MIKVSYCWFFLLLLLLPTQTLWCSLTVESMPGSGYLPQLVSTLSRWQHPTTRICYSVGWWVPGLPTHGWELSRGWLRYLGNKKSYQRFSGVKITKDSVQKNLNRKFWQKHFLVFWISLWFFWISGLLWISHHLMHGCVGHTAWGPEGEKDEVKQAQSKLEVKALRALRLIVAS